MEPTSFDVVLDETGRASGPFPTLPKYGVYLISIGTEVVRVGESSSGASRLIKGFREPLRRTLRGKERKNYIAYSWRHKYANGRIRIDYFGLTKPEFVEAAFRRALEAEITFQLRMAHKRWPIDMVEVHFSESHRTKALLTQVAKAILNHYGIAYDHAV
jgi:hypothetical protein